MPKNAQTTTQIALSSHASKVKWSEVKWLSRVRLFAIPWTVSYQASLSMGSSRQEYMEELYKKDLHDPGNHDGVITHQEPDILEGEVK